MKLPSWLFCFYFCFCFILLFSPSTTWCQTVETPIVEGEIVEGRVDDGRTFSLKAKGELLNNPILKFTFQTNSTSNKFVYSMILTDQFKLLSALQASRIHPSGHHVRTLCHRTKNVEKYHFNFTGEWDAYFRFSIIPIINSKLYADKPVNGYLVDLLQRDIYYFDVNTTDAPLEIYIQSPTDAKAMLGTSLDNCISLQKKKLGFLPGSTFLTLTSKAKLVLSDYSTPKLAVGRWYIGVKILDSSTKNYTLTVQKGLDYSDYLFPILLILFVLPVTTLILLLILGFAVSKLQETVRDNPLLKQEHELIAVRTKDERDSGINVFLVTILSGLLFGIPALQLAIREHNFVGQSGSRNMCYFNDFCTRPLVFTAFNSLWSNYGYIVSGLAFIIYVRWIENRDFYYFLPNDFSVYYAMGCSVIVIGIFSAVYHICPSKKTFQFDTAFMFVLAGISMLELHRKHFNKRLNVVVVFLLLGCIIGMNYIGVLSDTTDDEDVKFRNQLIFRLSFYFLFYWPVFFLLVTRYTYFYERKTWTGPDGILKTLYPFSRPAHMGRMFMLLVIFVGSTILTFVISSSSQMFLSLMIYSLVISANASVVFVWKSSPRPPRLIYFIWLFPILMGFATFVIAIYFFTEGRYDVRVSASLSRARNSNCIWLDFYDEHDVWHFVSAFFLLFGNLLIFHLERDGIKIPTS